jgi:hypothetical protein
MDSIYREVIVKTAVSKAALETILIRDLGAMPGAR